MIQEVKMYSIKCDRCGEDFIDPETGFDAYADECSAREAALNSNWAEIDGKHYCPNCYQYNEETDEYEPKND